MRDMMTGLITRAWKTVKPHVPLIKFKKGCTSKGHAVAQPSSAQSPNAAQPGGSIKAEKRPTIEDWQLPPRYRRPLLDEKEIDMINSGGAY